MSRPQRAFQMEVESTELQVRVVEREEEFRLLATEWNLLLARSAANTIFLTWEWLYSWWQHFGSGSQLAIILIERGNKLLGIAPLFQGQGRALGVLPIRYLQW